MSSVFPALHEPQRLTSAHDVACFLFLTIGYQTVSGVIRVHELLRIEDLHIEGLGLANDRRTQPANTSVRRQDGILYIGCLFQWTFSGTLR
jgi:hypothetical protein